MNASEIAGMTSGVKIAKKLYVGRLPFTMSDDQLHSHFSSHGKVVSARIQKDRETGRSRGFGYVEMATSGQASKAVSALNGKRLKGHNMAMHVEKNAAFDAGMISGMEKVAGVTLFGAPKGFKVDDYVHHAFPDGAHFAIHKSIAKKFYAQPSWKHQLEFLIPHAGKKVHSFTSTEEASGVEKVAGPRAWMMKKMEQSEAPDHYVDAVTHHSGADRAFAKDHVRAVRPHRFMVPPKHFAADVKKSWDDHGQHIHAWHAKGRSLSSDDERKAFADKHHKFVGEHVTGMWDKLQVMRHRATSQGPHAYERGPTKEASAAKIIKGLSGTVAGAGKMLTKVVAKGRDAAGSKADSTDAQLELMKKTKLLRSARKLIPPARASVDAKFAQVGMLSTLKSFMPTVMKTPTRAPPAPKLEAKNMGTVKGQPTQVQKMPQQPAPASVTPPAATGQATQVTG